jgi:hypothetical protein
MSQRWLVDSGEDVLIFLEIQPNSSQKRILGVEQWRGRLKVSVMSPPISGKANSELLELIASWISINKKYVTLENGYRNRRKTVRIKKIKCEQILSLLGE